MFAKAKSFAASVTFGAFIAASSLLASGNVGAVQAGCTYDDCWNDAGTVHCSGTVCQKQCQSTTACALAKT